MQKEFEEEIQKRLKNSAWDKQVAKFVVSSYLQERNKVWLLRFSFSTALVLTLIIGSFLYQNSTDIVQESLEIHEDLDFSFMEIK